MSEVSENQIPRTARARRTALVKSRANAPHAIAKPTRDFGIFADSRYRVFGGHRTGVIHFSV